MTQTLRLLLIDDNPSDRALVIRALQRSFSQLTIQEIITLSQLNRAIAAGNFDAVITDFQLRWTTGLDVLQMIKQRYPRCPVIMFTNTGTEEIAVEAMKLGLDDYLIKEPNRYIKVPTAVELALQRVADQQRAALLEIRLQGLLNQVKVGIFRSQPDGTLIEANRAFLDLLGAHSLAQANALNLLDTQACYQRLIALPQVPQQEREVQLQRHNGSSFWALLTTTLNTVEDATVVDGLLEDITDRKQAEATLQQLNTNLEARIQERTAELAATNQELEEFAYSIAHDLRAPLRAIQGYAQTLMEDIGHTLEVEQRSSLSRIAANAQQLDSLITDLLTYSRLKQNEIELSSISLAAALAEALAQLEPEIQAQQVQVHIAEPLPWVQANQLILVQALTNLLSNAIKFVAHEVHPQIRLWTEQDDQETRLWLADNGIGIAPENQQQIFKPFTRLHSQEEYPGSGLGLAIARKGIERLGGQLGVESQLGQGSRFWVRLPTTREAA